MRIIFLSMSIAVMAFAPVVYGDSNVEVNRNKVLDNPAIEVTEYMDAYSVKMEDQVKRNQEMVLQALEKYETEVSDLKTYASEHEQDFSTFKKNAFDIFYRHHEALVRLAAEQQRATRTIQNSYLLTLVQLKMILDEEISKKKPTETDDFLGEVMNTSKESLLSRMEDVVAFEMKEMQEKTRYGKVCFNFVGASGQVKDVKSMSNLLDEMETALNLALLEQGQELAVVGARVGEQKYAAEKEEPRGNLRATNTEETFNPFVQELRASFTVGFRCTTRCPPGEWTDLGDQLTPRSADSGDADSRSRFFSSKLEKSVAEALRRHVGGVLGQVIAVESFPCNEMNDEVQAASPRLL